MNAPARARLLLVALLPLSACLTEPPTTPGDSPAPPGRAAPLGLVEITISGIGTPQMSASASFPGREAGGPSFALTPVGGTGGSGDGTIQVQSLSTGNFTQGSRAAGGIRYLYATFRVRNAQSGGTAYNLPRQNLVFVAAARANTLGGTAISQMRRFDATVINNPTLAMDMAPTGAVYQQGGQLIRSSEPDVLQALTEAEAASITPAPDVTSVLPYGFVVRNANSTTTRTLPASPGAAQFDGVVTFAFKVPLQPTAAQDPYSVSLVFQPVDDSDIRLTQSVEEQSNVDFAALSARVSSLGAAVSVLPGGGYPGARAICALRTAGTAALPTRHLLTPRVAMTSRSPDPFVLPAVPVPTNTTFSATYAGPVSGAGPTTFVVNGGFRGRYFLAGSYTGNGTATIGAPAGTFRPGEELEVVLTSGIVGSCMPSVARFRTRASVAASATFAAAPTVPATFVQNVALGDLDGDLDLDLVQVNFSSVLVSLNNGAGGFSIPASVPTGSPSALVMGDLNGNGMLDLAVANFGSNDVSILLGNGAGGFVAAPGSPIAVGANPRAVATADLNADGRLDLVVSNWGTNTLSVLLGSGTGAFTAAPGSPVSVGSFPEGLAVADFNRDGRMDLASGSSGNGISLLLGTGLGTFVPAANSPIAFAGIIGDMVTADFNADGRADLAVGSFASVTILLGNASGGFTSPGSPIPSGSGQTFLEVNDVNGNGQLDLVVANSNPALTGTVSVLLGNGAGAFVAAPASPVPAGDSPAAVAVGDLNGDGRLDFVVGHSSASTTAVMLNLP